MSTFKSLLIIVPLAVSSAALAAPAHFTDTQYIAAARCQVLMSSVDLGHEDTHVIDALLRSEERSRSAAVLDLAQGARDDATRAIRHAGIYGKGSLIAERDGACRSLTGETMSADATTGGATHSN
jgi:hypothetical protein